MKLTVKVPVRVWRSRKLFSAIASVITDGKQIDIVLPQPTAHISLELSDLLEIVDTIETKFSERR